MEKSILVCKESKAGETRVALIPKDAKELICNGFTVFVEHAAGIGAGFSDQDYISKGCQIRPLIEESIEGYQDLFNGVDIIIRAKRPDLDREKLENKAIKAKTIMIGALDPLEKDSSHIEEYHQAQILAYSIDQMHLEPTDPMNILASMSKMAGKLALLDAKEKFQGDPKTALIIGLGIAGQAAFSEALAQKMTPMVVSTHPEDQKLVEESQGHFFLLEKASDLNSQQALVLKAAIDANLIVTSARRPGQKAPILFPKESLDKMKPGTVIVDMALSEGGNVEGSKHDETLTLGRDVLVTNISGYPKASPTKASEHWSEASKLFILRLSSNEPPPISPC